MERQQTPNYKINPIFDDQWYMENLEYIVTKKAKDGESADRLFKLNRPQKVLLDSIHEQEKNHKPVRNIVLKARQLGISTFVQGLFFHRTVTRKNVRTGIITHRDDSTANLFEISKHMYDSLPDGEMSPNMKPETLSNSSKQLSFATSKGKNSLNSWLRCMTATNKGVGRGTTFTQVHASEFAFWECDKIRVFGSICAGVPKTSNSIIIVESTANGYDEFRDMWYRAVNGESDFVPTFFPWFDEPDYTRPWNYEYDTLTKEEEELKKEFNLTNEQISWRRYTIKNDCSNDIEFFKQEYPATPEEAFISTGKCVFDIKKINEQLNKKIKPIKVGEFKFTVDNNTTIRNIEWKDNPRGAIKIYTDVENGHPYVIGGDTAGNGSDSFVGQVVDNSTGIQVAKLKSQFNEVEYTKQMYCLGMYYNKALLGIETNFSTYPVRKLEEYNYPNQYMRENREDSITHKITQDVGWTTTVGNREGILATLVEMFEYNPAIVVDTETLTEMSTFARDEKGKACAVRGAHDDCVMALAITYAIRSQQTYRVENVANDDWISKTILEEYNNKTRRKHSWGT